MIDTLCRTISRSAPASATPPTSACLIAHNRPNSTNATITDSSVSEVRSFFRFRLTQTRGRNFTARPSAVSFRRLAGELALGEMHGARRARRGVGIVRHHDNRLAVLAVQRLEQVEDFVAGL